MNNLKYFLLILIFNSTTIFSQENLNSYKYLIVPVRYEFQKSDDQYQVNSLTKFLFEKEGFHVFLSNEEFPDELKLNRCLALTARLNDNSKLFSTKMNFDLIDCGNKILFSTENSMSKSKDYKTAYHEVVRESFEGVKVLNYKYEPVEDDPIAVVKTETKPVTEVSTIATSGLNQGAVQKSANNANGSIIVPVATTAVVLQKEEQKETVVLEEVNQNPVKVASDVLYAQPNANGYQIVDSTPKVVYMLLKTSVKDVYLLKDHTAIVYKDVDGWKVEYYEEGKVVVKKLNLKFF